MPIQWLRFFLPLDWLAESRGFAFRTSGFSGGTHWIFLSHQRMERPARTLPLPNPLASGLPIAPPGPLPVGHHELRPVRRGRVVARVVADVVVAGVVVVVQIEIDAELRRPRLADGDEA